ncbi:hypothetical protein OE88DRAFT_1808650 [Heliocybe sulcata]|uniref:Uncharacterized protein n=1 Tax=Heliocybe sulcata TaxID=5364 RepID=A0A5C3MXM6_9AGAM|nr:hypothetical protein OE88DRAFT_1808650 [Heliocybe sulcata]
MSSAPTSGVASTSALSSSTLSSTHSPSSAPSPSSSASPPPPPQNVAPNPPGSSSSSSSVPTSTSTSRPATPANAGSNPPPDDDDPTSSSSPPVTTHTSTSSHPAEDRPTATSIRTRTWTHHPTPTPPAHQSHPMAPAPNPKPNNAWDDPGSTTSAVPVSSGVPNAQPASSLASSDSWKPQPGNGDGEQSMGSGTKIGIGTNDGEHTDHEGSFPSIPSQDNDDESPLPVHAAHLALSTSLALSSSPSSPVVNAAPAPASVSTSHAASHTRFSTTTSTFTTTLRSTSSGHLVESTSTGTSTYTLTFAVPDPSDASSGGKTANVGAIAGGVVGGVLALVLLFLLGVCVVKRKKRGVILDTKFTGRKSGESIKVRSSASLDGDVEKQEQMTEVRVGRGGRERGYSTVSHDEPDLAYEEGEETDGSLRFWNPFWDPSEPPSARTSVVGGGSVRSRAASSTRAVENGSGGSGRDGASSENASGTNLVRDGNSSIRAVENASRTDLASPRIADGTSSVRAVENGSVSSIPGAWRGIRGQGSWYSEHSLNCGATGQRVSRYSPAHRSRLSQSHIYVSDPEGDGEGEGERPGSWVSTLESTKEEHRPGSLVSTLSSMREERRPGSLVSTLSSMREDSVSPSPPRFAPVTAPSPELVFSLPNRHIGADGEAEGEGRASLDSGTAESEGWASPELRFGSPASEMQVAHAHPYARSEGRLGVSPSAASFGGRSVRSGVSEGDRSYTESWRGPNVENLVNHARRQAQQRS